MIIATLRRKPQTWGWQLGGADAVAVLTEWNEFRSLDLAELRAKMRGNLLLDARNLYDPNEARRRGFEHLGRGRGTTRSQRPVARVRT